MSRLVIAEWDAEKNGWLAKVVVSDPLDGVRVQTDSTKPDFLANISVFGRDDADDLEAELERAYGGSNTVVLVVPDD
jgi:hypothetical protein